MSTKALALWDRSEDSPWRRLYWTFPSALTIWFIVLWAFAYFMGKPAERLPEPPPIDAQVIEIPPPAPAAKTPPEEKRLPPPPPPMQQPAFERTLPPIQEEKEVAQPNPPKAPAIPEPPATPSPPVPEKPVTTSANLTGNSGAQAIFKPMRQLPDEFRQDALSISVPVRFNVATDGTATVELVKPTPNTGLNRFLLNNLKKWRFFPAMQDGKPVASTLPFLVKLEVK
ncbi:MAG: TonB family protein [Thiobacillaceae bacterium]